MTLFAKLDNCIVAVDTIEFIDDTRIEELVLTIKHKNGEDTCTGFFAIQLLWMLKPDALEGKRFHWRKNVWAIHNLFAHPLMQVLAFLGMHKTAIWIHDITAPQPEAKHETKTEAGNADTARKRKDG